ncbi:hypothetical protein CO057_00460 [Candidatus Uhrbacteria bacterium CG_4_9_14_0_2_um_filter_41_50]|uniref:Type II toxin-antitoxin system RelE/ParE family toxin n=1 Tax=Candidatus Uhrbacteria bacterium CG_4_9_14_0_2_um_filter_41_50 TaxID=1975031 RepID=A0A2M8EQ66_9BACT|nr:MAG: hypothetical protein COZ45_02235 [Candidatus Uhrbacteria bacterium CG_4_10_14_3_um_filter_41_21]PIZ54485.1 MAG: hypothetical protein COY24_03595 [Candidatus Uhrbacteria bacterium CG_4_10_14_0_2_um_filter_41_21]PJB84835.1 MAG: hypothetical protein CO086_01440 [Candidatus Uhrbacteria bacterium CG_4_9_14_0_8_um_filter_41_16]PJC24880.1 MAG: hypothetical protein CO057_00460 [Candidatus Uhrbacteria bacterium CG_4_9_14_0_2_um_filter_41_50]PJE75220.1 MAG: hypothetical protein COV03_01100 [Candi
MVNKIDKALSKFSNKEKAEFKKILQKVKAGDFLALDIKKLKNRQDIYRIRKGSMRIIFQKTDHGIKILSFERRLDNTYK